MNDHVLSPETLENVLGFLPLHNSIKMAKAKESLWKKNFQYQSVEESVHIPSLQRGYFCLNRPLEQQKPTYLLVIPQHPPSW